MSRQRSEFGSAYKTYQNHGGGANAHFTLIENCALVLPTPFLLVNVRVDKVDVQLDTTYVTVKSKRKSLTLQYSLDILPPATVTFTEKRPVL